MASCCCHNLCAHDRCLLAQGAFGSPRTISALWSSESGKSYQCQAMQTQPWAKKLSFQWKIHADWICASAGEHAWPSCWQIQRGTSVDSSGEGLDFFFYCQQGQSEGNGLHFSFPAPAAGQGGWETLTWPPVRRACQKPPEFRGRTSPNERETLRLGFTLSREMQPCANWTGPLRNLDRHRPAEQQEGRERDMQRVLRGLWGARSFHLTGCFINVIKHGQALWFCIIPDLHSRGREGRKRERETGKGRGEGRIRGHLMGRIRMKQERIEQRGIDGARNGKYSVTEPLMGLLCYRGSRPRHLRKKKGQRQGKEVPPESVVKCEECHVIILDTVQRTV